MTKKLFYNLKKPHLLSDEHRDRMFNLMNQNYDCMSLENFKVDLSKKDFAGIITDEDNLIQGFTTYAINPSKTGGVDYNIIFSGDTIIAPEHWGSQIMMEGFCRTVGSVIASDNSKKWYWYLLSKGHRTYMYLPIFFETYYPALEDKDEYLYKTIVHESSLKMYGDQWKPDLGLLRFDKSLGELKPKLTENIYRKKSPHVQLFLQKNPQFYKGEELVCMTLLTPSNAKRSAKTFMLEGMRNPINDSF